MWNEEAKSTTAVFPGHLENQTGMNQELFRIPKDSFNLGCRKPTQTKHRRLCRERKICLHLRHSPEGQGEEWGQLGNWRNEMVYQTGHRKNLKNAKISNLSNEPSELSKKQAKWALRATQLVSPLQGCLTAKLYGWDHPASHSQDRL